MAYKIHRAAEAYTYEAPGHFGVITTRLCDAGECDGSKMILGLSHFYPGGGCEYGANPLESIYYIVDGQMTLKTEDQETTLFTGDCFHCSGGTPKSIINNGCGVTKMLVALLPPQA